MLAAQCVGSGGRVLATDVSASMLEVAAESARQAGLNNVDTRVTSPAPERFGEFRLAATGALEDAYRTAGFREISIHAVPTRRRFPSLGEAIQYARGPLPLRELLARLSRAEQEQAWAEIERVLAQFVGPQGFDSPCELLIGVGTK